MRYFTAGVAFQIQWPNITGESDFITNHAKLLILIPAIPYYSNEILSFDFQHFTKLNTSDI